MVKLDNRWDYECFCKKDHVSYSTRHPDLHQRDNKSKVNYGGYRETCQQFNCPLALDERKEIGFQNSTDERYKIFLPKAVLIGTKAVLIGTKVLIFWYFFKSKRVCDPFEPRLRHNKF